MSFVKGETPTLERDDSLTLTRRRFVQGVAVAGFAALVEGKFNQAGAETIPHSPTILTGTHFDLAIEPHEVDFTGRRRKAIKINGSLPGPTLKWREGGTITIAVTNHLREATSIHWHGMRVPAGMDGVPGLSFAEITPGQAFVYRFPVVQNGTYWYHSHHGAQEQIGLLGGLIIEPRDKDPIAHDRDYVVLLSDWTDTDPDTLYANLKKQSDYYNFHKRTAGTFIDDVETKGLRPTIADRLRWGRNDMTPTDIADVNSSTYIYLMNGNPPGGNWTALFNPGERVRLRFINGSAMTLFDVRIPGLPMTVVQADGNCVQPVTVDEFRIGTAETYDVVVQPREEKAYTIFAQPEARGRYARGTLAPRMGMTAEIPPMDPYPNRTMADMGMVGMANMRGAKMNGMSADNRPEMKDTNQDTNISGMKDSGMSAVSQTHMDQPAEASSDPLAGATPFPRPGPRTTRLMPPLSQMMPRPTQTLEGEVPLRIGPEVVTVMKTSSRLHEPGDGLDGNGRRVLTYADLRALYRGVDGRQPTREIILHVTGSMERFIWSFDGRKFSQAEPIHLKLGERVRFVLINDTMMEHPIHLHGLWSELENGSGEFAPQAHAHRQACRAGDLPRQRRHTRTLGFPLPSAIPHGSRNVSYGYSVMRSRLALQLVFAGTLLSFGRMPVFAQDPSAPAGAPAPSTLPDVPTTAPNWPQPIKDNKVLTFVTFSELEGRTSGPNTSFRWEGEGWIGTDFNKFWFKSEASVTNGATSDGDHEFLYDRPIPHLRYFDWQAGARVDIDSGPTRGWLALGVQGLARYFFNFAPTLYIRDGGHVAGKIEGYYDLYLTQRLILQPQAELNFYSQPDRARGIGTGLSDLDGGVRLGYQFSRKFAPYIGYVYTGTFGQTATLSRQAGDPTGIHQFVFGILRPC